MGGCTNQTGPLVLFLSSSIWHGGQSRLGSRRFCKQGRVAIVVRTLLDPLCLLKRASVAERAALYAAHRAEPMSCVSWPAYPKKIAMVMICMRVYLPLAISPHAA